VGGVKASSEGQAYLMEPGFTKRPDTSAPLGDCGRSRKRDVLLVEYTRSL